MKSFLLRTLALALTLGWSTAHATLIGDTITLAHHFPNLNTVDATLTTVVSAGTSDQFTYLSNYRVNPEASSVAVVFLRSASFTSGAGFNGLVVSGINDTIFGVTYNTNLAGFTPSRLTYDAHSVSVNWQSLPFTADSFFDIFFEITPGNPTPDGGATAAMLGLAIMGLAAMCRRVA